MSEVEVATAFARRQRDGAFNTGERDRAIKALNEDLAAWIVVELTPQLAAEAQSLIVRHGLRSDDAVQLASCLYLRRETGRRLTFAAFDDRLRIAAKTEGLAVFGFGDAPRRDAAD